MVVSIIQFLGKARNKKFVLPLLWLGIFAATNAAAQNFWQQTDGPYGGIIQAFAINPTTQDIFAGTFLGGVFRSTNKGDSWTAVNTGLTSTSVSALAINSSGNIFAGTNGGVFRSTNNGDSWTAVNTGLTNTNVLDLAINSNGHIFAGTGVGVFRSTNNGDSWTAVNTGLTSTFVFALAINASGHIFAGTNGGGVFRSTNNGDSWTAVNTGLTTTDVRALAINSSGDIFAGTIGGVFRSVQSTTACTNIAYDQSINGAIGSAGEVDCFTFSGVTGQRVNVFLDNRNEVAASFSLRLSRPDGSSLAFCNFSLRDCEIDTVTLPTTGVYTVTVDGSGASKGNYTVAFNLLGDTETIANGQSLNRVISPMGDQDTFSFSGVARQRATVFLDNQNEVAASFSLRLNGTDGKSLAFCNFSLRDCQIDTVALPATGIYTLIVDGSGASIGNYALTLNSTGGQATLGISSRTINFAPTSVGSIADQAVTVTNTGNTNLNISSTRITGTNAADFAIVAGGGPTTLPPSSSSNMTVRFSPQGVGNKTATLVINSNASSTPDTVSLSGTATFAQGIAQDSLALMDLYNSTNGANWTNKTTWLSAQPVSTWFGVTVAGNRVTQLNSINNNLIGALPTTIGNLTSLTSLDLRGNQLSGAIPNAIGNLTNLTILLLGPNQLSGTIPTEIFNLPNLNRLSLGVNQLSGVIPTQIGNLTNLNDLNLGGNQLSGAIPAEIFNLTNLSSLHLGGNKLSGTISTQVGNLTNLTSLALSDNQLTGSIPKEIGKLTQLTGLSLGGNQLSGSIPTEIGNLTNLKSLILHRTQLSGAIPPEIGNLTNLIILWLHLNQLSGSIPAVLSNLTNLTDLHLHDNQLSGTVPSVLGNLINLQFLILSGNQLSGSVPTEIRNLTKLTEFWIQNNQFIDLPDLSPIDSLRILRIEQNKFTFEDIEPNLSAASQTFTYSPQDSVGTAQNRAVAPGSSLNVSVTVGGANNRYQWFKNGTSISGATNNAYSIAAVNLADAGAYTCRITNTVASALTLFSRPINVTIGFTPLQQDSLALVDLYNSTNGANWTNKNNWLIGPVSTWFGVTVAGGRINRLALVNNNLVGTIPITIGNLTNLTSLELSRNQLTGTIPAEIGNLINLTGSDLGANRLTGIIPREIGNLTKLNSLNLGTNQLTGSIPTEISKLTNLTNLSLSANRLSGAIPRTIGNLTNLTNLNVRVNQLSGPIPVEIGNLTNLIVLNLGPNQLSGAIPTDIGRLTNLTR